MAGNNRLYKHFKPHSLEAQVRDTIEKNSKIIKEDSVVVNIVIEPIEKLDEPKNLLHETDIPLIDPIQVVCISHPDANLVGKVLPIESSSDIMTEQTNKPKKGKKNKKGRNKKNGT